MKLQTELLNLICSYDTINNKGENCKWKVAFVSEISGFLFTSYCLINNPLLLIEIMPPYILYMNA